MIPIKKCIEEIVLENPFLEDALYNNYLNLSSFALYIKPRVKQMCKKEVSIWSIKVILSRIAQKYQKESSYNIIKTDRVFVRKNMNLLSVDNSSKSEKFLRKISSKITFSEKDYFGIIKWISETDIIFSSNLRDIIHESIDHSMIKIELNNVWAIWVSIDEKSFKSKGVIYNLIKKLAFYNINIFAISSTYTEILFVIEQDDLSKAFEVFII